MHTHTRGKYPTIINDDVTSLSEEAHLALLAVEWRECFNTKLLPYCVADIRYINVVVLGRGKGQLLDWVEKEGRVNRRSSLYCSPPKTPRIGEVANILNRV